MGLQRFESPEGREENSESIRILDGNGRFLYQSLGVMPINPAITASYAVFGGGLHLLATIGAVVKISRPGKKITTKGNFVLDFAGYLAKVALWILSHNRTTNIQGL